MPYKSKEANARWRARMEAKGIKNPYAFENSMKQKAHSKALKDAAKRFS